MKVRTAPIAAVPALLALVLLSFVASCAGPKPPKPEAPSPAPAARPKPAMNIPELERQIHLLVNRERQANGLNPLALDTALSAVARKHSQDMADKGYFSHESPDGRGFAFRYAEARYSCNVREGNKVHMGAENIFQNNLYDKVTIVGSQKHYEWNSMRKIAESTVQGWMNSPGHRKNILTPYWRNHGIGISISTDDKVYITQNFC